VPILAAGSEKKGGVAAQDYTLCRGCKSSEFTLKVTGKPNWHGVWGISALHEVKSQTA
jgi:hypothetical protein